MSGPDLRELLEFIVRSLAGSPDQVEVEEGERGRDPCLRIRVAKSDRGRVIGRQGRTIRHMEAVLGAALRGGRAPALEIVDTAD